MYFFMNHTSMDFYNVIACSILCVFPHVMRVEKKIKKNRLRVNICLQRQKAETAYFSIEQLLHGMLLTS